MNEFYITRELKKKAKRWDEKVNFSLVKDNLLMCNGV